MKKETVKFEVAVNISYGSKKERQECIKYAKEFFSGLEVLGTGGDVGHRSAKLLKSKKR